MAKREPVLKWRKVKDEWRAGCFVVYREPASRGIAWSASDGNGWTNIYWVDAEHAKRACERLARKIIAATKKGRKHGK